MILPEAMRRGLARGLAGALLFAFGTQAAHARGETSVWSMKDARFPEQLERAYQAAEVIVLEVDLEDMDPLEAVRFITSNGTLPADQSLESVIGATGYQRISRLAASLEIPEIVLAKLEPWAAALVLTQFALTKTGFDANLGIDMQITERAKSDGKPVEGLETVIDQLSVFDARPFEEQTRFLLDSADDAPKLDDDLQKLIAAWRAGDLPALEQEFIKERARSPRLYDALLGVRNRKWLPKIEALLKEERDYLVVVGALHFVGRDGLLALLKQDGHKAVAVPAVPKP
jgi:uncharacterized protein YbaP (TraB family)